MQPSSNIPDISTRLIKKENGWEVATNVDGKFRQYVFTDKDEAINFIIDKWQNFKVAS